MMVIEHPFDNRYVSSSITLLLILLNLLNPLQAFVLSEGKKHYRTEDRGKTWRPFEVPLPPAMVAAPLSFHSDPKKYGYILYQGMSCKRQGWGSVCHDEVNLTHSSLPPRPLTHQLFHLRHSTQKKRSVTTQNFSSPKPLVANLSSAARTSKQMPTQTSSSASPSTLPLQPSPTPSPPPVSSPAPTSFPQTPQSKTSE